MIEIEVLGNKDTRSGFGDGLLELAKTNENVVALCADLTGSLKMNGFEICKKVFGVLVHLHGAGSRRAIC